MRSLKLALLLPLALVLGFLVIAGVTRNTHSPQARAAAATSDIKALLQAFTQAMYDADERAVFDCFVFTTDQDRQEARAFAAETLDYEHFQHALNAEFSSPPSTAPAPTSIPADLARRLAGAKITVSGDTAEAQLGASAIFCVRRNNVWKIDFTKTQRTQRGPYDKNKVAELSARSQAINEVIAEIQAHKYETRAQANQALDERLPPLRPATTSSATKPAASQP
jgi:hypothetical protein